MSDASGFNRAIFSAAVKESFKKLNPKVQWTNPVMFVVEVLAVLTTYFTIRDISAHYMKNFWFDGQIAFWLWITVIFANFAESLAEGRGNPMKDIN